MDSSSEATKQNTMTNERLEGTYRVLEALAKIKPKTTGPYTFKLLTMLNTLEPLVRSYRETTKGMISEMFPDAKPDDEGMVKVTLTDEQAERMNEVKAIEVEVPELKPITFADAEKAGVAVEPELFRALGTLFTL